MNNTSLMQYISNQFEENPITSLIIFLIVVGVIYYILDVFVIPDECTNHKNKEE